MTLKKAVPIRARADAVSRSARARIGLIGRNRAHGLLWTGMTASTLGSMATLYALLLYLALAAAGLLLAATSPRTVFGVAGAGVLAVLLLVRAMLPGSLDEADAE